MFVSTHTHAYTNTRAVHCVTNKNRQGVCVCVAQLYLQLCLGVAEWSCVKHLQLIDQAFRLLVSHTAPSARCPTQLSSYMILYYIKLYCMLLFTHGSIVRLMFFVFVFF